VVAGSLVAVPLLFLNFTLVTNLTSIGTLFAFALVCGGVMVIHYDRHSKKYDEGVRKRFPDPKFRVPYVNGKWIVPLGFVAGLIIMLYFNRTAMMDFISFRNSAAPEENWMTVGRENLPYWIFVIYAFLISAYSFTRNLSLIPILGLTMCVYLMSALTVTTWEGFTIWLVAGLIIYFFYSYQNSKLHTKE